jgi:CubicO group peptidase (beta-lactamase class C family)
MSLSGKRDRFEWLQASPESQGMDGGRLSSLWEDLSAGGTQSFLVVKNDKMVFERYAPDFHPESKHYTASLAKTLVGSLSLLIALQDGRMQLDDPASKYIPWWKDDPHKVKISIHQLATHTSGLEDAEEAGRDHSELNGWKGEFWQKREKSFHVALEEAPVLFEPGAGFHYSNTGMAALAYAVTVSLQGTPQSDLFSLLKSRIMNPIGVSEEEWSIGYNEPQQMKGLTLYANWGGGSFTARAVARVARLLLNRGSWEGRQLIDSCWVDAMTFIPNYTALPEGFPASFSMAPGLCCFKNHCGVIPSLPDCAFFGLGAGHQIMMIVPSWNLIAVRMGSGLVANRRGQGFFEALAEQFAIPLGQALAEVSPYPASSTVREVSFAPESEIAITGEDSDNWPTTWADDGEQYTSYGDGYGFMPHTDKKLSLGFAKLIGDADGFRGINIRSDSGEAIGDGQKGAKSSGLVMIDSVLYMLVRNVNNSQLLWSEDGAKTWEWGFRLETSFSCPAFVNYGRNYEGAPDEYAYIYSPDGSSAYESYDHVVLARVRKDRLRDREAYEFFQHRDRSGQAVWTSDIEQRGPVFTYPEHCYRLEAVYHAATRRYWLVLAFNHEGGWGIFDAPSPWGPWTTVYFTPYWGLGRTHAYRIPTKWIKENGEELRVIFSGHKFRTTDYDALCLRKMSLTLID